MTYDSLSNQSANSLGLLSTGLLSLVTGLLLLFSLTTMAETPKAAGYNVVIPAQSGWLDCGPILAAGEEGDWDHLLWGGFAASVVKKDGTYYLYYQGASGYDEGEGTVTWRSIGVATSPDGINFTKYAANPVLTWFPNSNLEEGAVSAGAFLDETGEVALYYGANSWAGGRSVNADGRLAVSADGFHFTDAGIVLYHRDRSLWGAGDELFPIIGFHDAGRWFAYYIPNGVLQKGKLGVAWGSDRNQLANSTAARTNGLTIPVWGPGSSARIGPDTYALFLNDVYRGRGPTMEVRVVSLSTPGSLSAPVQTYRFGDVWEGVVYLDESNDRWLMVYRSADHASYGLKVAPAGDGTVACAA
jgi:hypothetical protein